MDQRENTIDQLKEEIKICEALIKYRTENNVHTVARFHEALEMKKAKNPGLDIDVQSFIYDYKDEVADDNSINDARSAGDPLPSTSTVSTLVHQYSDDASGGSGRDNMEPSPSTSGASLARENLDSASHGDIEPLPSTSSASTYVNHDLENTFDSGHGGILWYLPPAKDTGGTTDDENDEWVDGFFFEDEESDDDGYTSHLQTMQLTDALNAAG